MTEKQQQSDSSKTLVSFVVGLLIGGILVWAFSGDDHKDLDDSAYDDEQQLEADMDDDAMGEEEVEGDTSDAEAEAPAAVEATAEVAPVVANNGAITVTNQPAGDEIILSTASYPMAEGWVGVRQYTEGELGYILGVVQFSQAAELAPDTIVLQSPTVAGNDYAVVLFESDGNPGFQVAGDVPVEGIAATFTAQ